MKTTIPPLELNRQELEEILARALTAPLGQDDYRKLHAVLETLAYMTQLLENKNTTLQRLRQMVFGASTEKTGQILQNMADQTVTSSTSATTGEQGNEVASPQTPCSPSGGTQPAPGHGRNGAQAYLYAETMGPPHLVLASSWRPFRQQHGRTYLEAGYTSPKEQLFL